jgi:hypothetical protein
MVQGAADEFSAMSGMSDAGALYDISLKLRFQPQELLCPVRPARYPGAQGRCAPVERGI